MKALPLVLLFSYTLFIGTCSAFCVERNTNHHTLASSTTRLGVSLTAQEWWGRNATTESHPDDNAYQQQQQQQQQMTTTSTLAPRRLSVFTRRTRRKTSDKQQTTRATPHAALASSTLEETTVTTTPTTAYSDFKIFCDLDGVLVDFERGVRPLFPETDQAVPLHVDALDRSDLWRRVSTAGAFFSKLPWTPEGKELWQALRPLGPDILTGVPATYNPSRREKWAWCQRELQIPCVHVDKAGQGRLHYTTTNKVDDAKDSCRVITCWSNNKHYESGPGRVLIDDRLELREAWVAKGGIFVHHTSVPNTLRQLRDLGIL